MSKIQKKIKHLINSDINVGDIVNIHDGSGLTCQNLKNTEVFIVISYKELTGTDKVLINLDFKVTKTNITDLVCNGFSDTVYLQDVEIEYNGVKFNTFSDSLHKSKLNDKINSLYKIFSELPIYSQNDVVNALNVSNRPYVNNDLSLKIYYFGELLQNKFYLNRIKWFRMYNINDPRLVGKVGNMYFHINTKDTNFNPFRKNITQEYLNKFKFTHYTNNNILLIPVH
jgi:hypothetical protein